MGLFVPLVVAFAVRVRWFYATPALERTIADLVERERLGDFVGVAPLPAGVTAHGWD